MNNLLDDKLCNKYPKIFKDRHKDMQQTAMCWGFEHGDGWYQLLDALCFQIQQYVDWQEHCNQYDLTWNQQNPHQLRTVRPKVQQVVAEQIKEKFGTLRFYYRGGDDYIHGLVAMAEGMSARICEQCGDAGKIRGVGWYYTACDKHTKPEDLEGEQDEQAN